MPSLLDDDWSKGIVRAVEGQRIPKGGVYDCVNGLLDDDLGIYRRGGSAYKSSVDTVATLRGLAVAQVAAGRKVFVWTSTKAYVLDGSGVPVEIASSNPPEAFARGVVVNGGFVVPRLASSGGANVRIYGGSDNGSYSTGTVTVTAGSQTVTGAGTSWNANLEAGMFFSSGGAAQMIRSVDSDTALTLWAPWEGATAAGAAYSAAGVGAISLQADFPTPIYVAAAGTRLIAAGGDRVAFTSPGGAVFGGFATDDYHILQEAGVITGAQGIGNTAMIFTTAGVRAITNLAFDLTDAYGNPQQAQEKISDELILWDNAGIATWQGGMVVPAIDDVFLLGPTGEMVPVSQKIRPLYRGYVKAGYRTGTGAVARGHYFLPVLSGTTWVDTLVCRLDNGEPGWTRWDGHAGGVAYAREVGESTRSPKLLSLAGVRVADLSGCFAPAAGNKQDADVTTHVLSVVTRDYSVKAMVKAFWREVRARFELTDAASDNPTLTVEHAVGPVAGESWTSVGSWAEGTGEAPTRLAVGKSAQAIRFRLRSSGACASLALRSLEVFFRGSRKR